MKISMNEGPVARVSKEETKQITFESFFVTIGFNFEPCFEI